LHTVFPPEIALVVLQVDEANDHEPEQDEGDGDDQAEPHSAALCDRRGVQRRRPSAHGGMVTSRIACWGGSRATMFARRSALVDRASRTLRRRTSASGRW